MRTSNAAKLATTTLVMLLAMAGSDLAAQEPGAMSWLPWSGCWVEVDAPADAPMTCIVPENGAATLLTVTADGVTERQQLDGTGAEIAVDAGGCVGAEAAEFSPDGTRLYTRSRVSCDGGNERSTRGLMAMVSPDEWIRVRAMTVGKGSASWVTRYRQAPSGRMAAAGLTELAEATRQRGMAIETARMAASAAPTVDDIIEAHARTDAEAVRAWIAEHGTPIALDADGLIRMADAGVDEAVIDVAVAVSYPEHFVLAQQVERGFDDRDRYGARDRYGYGYGDRDMWPYYNDRYYYGSGLYSRYGYSRYGYSPYGYGQGGYGYYGTPTVIVVHPSDEAEPRGKAVKGRGFTRSGGGSTTGSVRPARPSSAQSGQGYSGASRPQASPSSRGSSSSEPKGKAKPKGGGGGEQDRP